MIKWTPEARAFVLALWETHLSASQIAERVAAEHYLTVTKSSVIGIAFRAGKAFSGPRSSARLAAARAARAAKLAVPKSEEALRRDRERKAAKAIAKPAPAPRPTPAQRPAIPAGIPVSLGVPLVEIREGGCRFIADDPRAGGTCCGHTTQHGSPYCAAHHALCTVPVRRSVSLWQPAHRRAA